MLPKYKEIAELIKKGATLEAQEKIMELREASLQLQEENLQLRSKVKELEDKLATKENLIWEKPFYWRIKENGQREGPFCQQCHDKEQKPMRLIEKAKGRWVCNSCKTAFFDSSHQPQQTGGLFRA